MKIHGFMAGLLMISGSLWQGDAAAPPRGPQNPIRVPQVPGSLGYRFTDFLRFPVENPVALATPPGETGRLFIVEQRGCIVVVTNLAAPTRTVFLDITRRTVSGGEQGLLGLAFHPRYAANGRFFVFRTQRTGPAGVQALHDVLSEFRVAPGSPNAADPDSEIPLFRQPDDAPNHNGGDLHFGADGYLYVSVGDEGGGDDNFRNSQVIDRDLFAGVLRIDVDRRPGSLPPNRDVRNSVHEFSYTTNYAIPPDNPFVGATQFLGRAVDPARVRTEFWSVGLRNPWRMSFDRATGELWIGDVGQGAEEMVVLSRAGANHGWAFREGNRAGPRTGAPAGFLTDPSFQYVRPVYTYLHGSGPMRGFSITGGVVYRGRRISPLHGAYLFADHVSGNVWSLHRSPAPGGAPRVTRLGAVSGVSAFGVDPRDGEVLLCQLGGGRVLRLEYSDQFVGEPLPLTLSETGAFADLAALTPAPGVVPYEINLPFWSDGAFKRRWFALPGPDRFIDFATNGAWRTPPGTVWVKHFELEDIEGDAASVRRLETRFLVRNSNGVHGFTYRWTSASDAVLVPEDGGELQLDRRVQGESFRQTWRFPSRAECLACHTLESGHSLSFQTAQLHRPVSDPAGPMNQIEALAAAGYFSGSPGSSVRWPVLAPPEEDSASVESRARSWLAVNCASCHRAGGTGGGFLDLRLETPTSDTGMVFGRLNDDGGDSDQRVVLPGDPVHSMLLTRIGIRGPRQMPPLASVVPDPAGVALIRRWIDEIGDPHPGVEDSLEAVLLGDRILLRAVQPANRRLNLETTDRLETGDWRPVDLPGNEIWYPAEPREPHFEVPISDGGWFRVRPSGP